MRDQISKNNEFVVEIKKLTDFKTIFETQLASLGKINNDLLKCNDDNKNLSS